jgi:hypothetical protein
MVLVSSLRTMHLVESLAVELYGWPKSQLQQRNQPLYQAFVAFEAGERRHREIFSDGLSAHNADPFFFTTWLALFVGSAAYLISFLLGFRALLYFEIVIESVAIWHYGKILQRGLPEPWQEKVREIQQDEQHHLTQMKHWLKRL